MWVVYHNLSFMHEAWIFPDEETANIFVGSTDNWRGEITIVQAAEHPSRISDEWGFCYYCMMPLNYNDDATVQIGEYHAHDECERHHLMEVGHYKSE